MIFHLSSMVTFVQNMIFHLSSVVFLYKNMILYLSVMITHLSEYDPPSVHGDFLPISI
jgi:hypothetical protein